MEGEVAGVLVVGEKLSGEIFDGDEIELLEMLAGETVIALKNAGLYQDLRSRMDELLHRAIELLRPKLAGGSVEVERVFDLSLPPIAGDRDQLTQVFLNLITNALDAMERGGRVVLETSIHQEDDGRTMVTVSVADTGRGIPPGHRARIFEAFYTTKDEGRGTGLGLSGSLGIVQMHEGSIEVESKLGHGTTVRVTLPVWEAPMH